MGKTYCSADWHGDLELAKKVLEYLQPDDTLYILGDVIDRGEYGIEILQMLMKDYRVILLRGNHEQMMLDEYRGTVSFDNRHLWDMNGNLYTERKFDALSAEEKEEILKYLEQTELTLFYRTSDYKWIILEHAGYTPGSNDDILGYHDPLWDRKHFRDKWYNKGFYVIHGHTPVQFLKFEFGYEGQTIDDSKEFMELKRQYMENGMVDYKPEVLCYCDGHKFDIDMCTAASGRVALIDINTFECKYFDKEDKK
jgi:serine/threonine protein phosphatase 1